MAKLYLIAGHGAGDSGAVGNGYTEAERVRTLCSRIKELGGYNVVYLDPSRNWYKDGGLKTFTFPSNCCILECHLDSSVPSAKGGHVIKAETVPIDNYDLALESMVKAIFPGRTKTIDIRDNLGNANRAKARGINYRLVEFGFISNSNDIQIFNSRLEEIARKVLECFDIEIKEEKKEEPKMANVFQYPLDGGDKQKWNPQRLANGKIMLKNKFNGEYLDVFGGVAKDATNVQTYKKNNSVAQQWILQKKKGYTPEDVAPYELIPAANTKARLDIAGASKGKMANAQIWTDNNSDAQTFAVIDDGKGYWCLININSMMALSV